VETSRAADRTAPGSGRIRTLLVCLVTAVLLGPSTVKRELMPPDEPRFGLVAREMYASGDFVVPTRGGEPYLEKPPLLFWAAAGVFALTGGAGETTARLPSLLATILLTALLHRSARRWYGEPVASNAALVFASSALVLQRGAWMATDALLALGVFGAVIEFERMRDDGARSAAVRAAGWLAFAVLAKGPVALLLVGLALTAGAIAGLPPIRLRRLLRPAAMITMIGGVSTWPVALALRAGGVSPILDALWKQTATRYFASWDNLEPWWYYAEALPLAMLPWTVLAPAAFDGAVFASLKRDARSRWIAIWAGLALLAFSIPGGKRGVYLLPLVPALALLIARVVSLSPSRTTRSAVAAVSAVLGAGLALAAAVAAVDPAVGGLVPHELGHSPAVRRAAGAIFGALASGFAWLAIAALRDWRGVLKGPLAALLLVGAGAPWLLSPALDEAQGARRAAQQIEAMTGPGETIALCRSKWELIAWYVDRPVLPLETAEDVERFLAEGSGAPLVCREEQLPDTRRRPPTTGSVRIGRLELLLLRAAGPDKGGSHSEALGRARK
jgi:4-amino-4-deoxy-L-arabinose transferase-like glycosyltransferase